MRFRDRFHPSHVYLFHSIFMSAAFSLAWTINQVYRVQAVGMDPLQLVLAGTTLEVTVLLFEIPTGVLADVYSRRLSTIIGVLVIGLSFILEGSFPSVTIVLLSQVIWGIGWTFISGAHDAWIADEIGSEEAAPLYLRATSLGLISNLAAIPLSVFIASFGLNLPFYIAGGLCLLLALLLIFLMTEKGFQPVRRSDRQSWQTMVETLQGGIRLVRGKPILVAFMAAAIFVGLYSEGFDRLTEAHFLTNFEFPSFPTMEVVAWFGVVRAGRILLSVGATELARRRVRLEQNQALVRALQLSYGLVVLGILLFAQTGSFWVALLATWLVHSMRALAEPLKTAWINQHIESRVRATILSTTSQMDAFGQMIGGPISGAVGTIGSIRAALTTSALMLLPALPLYQRLKQPDSGDSPG